jgi:hypothetical protein
VNGYETIDILKAYFPNDPLMWSAGKYLEELEEKVENDIRLDIDIKYFLII